MLAEVQKIGLDRLCALPPLPVGPAAGDDGEDEPG